MKLATMRDGSRDGQLVVVSRDLAQAHYASAIASHLQQVLDDWNFLAPQLDELCAELNAGRARHAFTFDAAQCLAPLPRSYAWHAVSAYPSHEQRCAQGRPPSSGAGAGLRPPVSAWTCGSESELDFSAGLAVITGDLPRVCDPQRALPGVRLVGLALELASAADAQVLARTLAPVVVTPDELGQAWHAARAHLTVQVQLNGRKLALCDAGADMAQDFGVCLAQAARAQGWPAGGIVAALPVSNVDAARGFGSLRERRCVETGRDGSPGTPWLRAGDVLRVQARASGGDETVFGPIELQIEQEGHEPKPPGAH